MGAGTTSTTAPGGAGATIELWFDFGSNYSYLSVMRIEQDAARLGVAVAWKPFLLGPVFRELGFADSPFVLQKEKGRYAWIDMARQCRKYGLRWTRPTRFPRSALLPHRVALLGAGEPWVGEFCRRIITMNFADDREIEGPEASGEVLEAMGLPARVIVGDAQSEPNKLRLRRQTEEARARRVFGAPTFFVGEEMFWGNDRLDDALDCAAAKTIRRSAR